MKCHELKLQLPYFYDVYVGKKTFEIRKNDRDYKVGDILELNLYDPVERSYKGFERDFKYTPEQMILLPSDYLQDPTKLVPTDENNAAKVVVHVTYITDYEQKPGYVVMGIEREQAEKSMFAELEDLNIEKTTINGR